MIFDLSEIAKLRRRLGMTQKELARRCDVSQSLIAKIEAGTIDPAYSKASSIIESLRMMSNNETRAGDIANTRIISLSPDDTLKKATDKMQRYQISQLPVIVERDVIGLICETTVLDALMKNIGSDAKVKDIMQDPPPTVTGIASLELIHHLLKEYPMVLVKEKGRLKGHITRSDLLAKSF